MLMRPTSNNVGRIFFNVIKGFSKAYFQNIYLGFSLI